MYDYLVNTYYPELPLELVEAARIRCLDDNLRIVPGCKIVVVPRTPRPTAADNFIQMVGFYDREAPSSIFLLPRDTINDIGTIIVRTQQKIEEARLHVKAVDPDAYAYVDPNLTRWSEAVLKLTPEGRVARTIKHEFGHLLHEGFFGDSLGEFEALGYLELAYERDIVKLGEPISWNVIAEAIAEDFVHTMDNPFFPNVHAGMDLIHWSEAERGSAIVKELVNKRVAEGKPITAPSTLAETMRPSTLLADSDPIALYHRNLDRITNGEYDSRIRKLGDKIRRGEIK